MTEGQFYIQLIACVVAAACALPGVFLVLRKTAMVSDAISHTVLLGIVLTFFIVDDLNNPLLILGATAIGVLTVLITEILIETRLVKQDAAIGLTFPALFSIAVILISVFARNVHIDTDAVFQGDLLFTPFTRFQIGGVDLGPKMLWTMGGILLINTVFILLFYKELKLTTFDPGLAAAMGFSPILINYALISLVSVTAVGAFDAVGSILVVALMIAPAVTAYMLTNRLSTMLILSVLIGVTASITGFWLATALDGSISGAIVTMLGVLFTVVFFVAPEKGMLAIIQRRLRQRWEFAQTMLAIHLSNHENGEDYLDEAHIEHCTEHMHWERDFAERVVQLGQRNGLIRRRDDVLYLTDIGRIRAQHAMTR